MKQTKKHTVLPLKVNNELRLKGAASTLFWLYNPSLGSEDFGKLFTRFLEGENFVEPDQKKESFEYGIMSRRLRLVNEVRFVLRPDGLEIIFSDQDLVEPYENHLKGVYVIKTDENGVTKIEPQKDTISKIYCHPEVCS